MRLKKALYGLRQAPRRWFETLSDALLKNGMIRSLKDPCVMFLRDGNFKINSASHVDDILFTTTDKTRFQTWFNNLKFTFGVATWLACDIVKYISIDFTYDMAQQFLRMTQRRYIIKALKALNYDSDSFKSSNTPMEFGCKHRKDEMPALGDADPKHRKFAQKCLGIAGWLCQTTMPEVVYAWSYLAQFASNPNLAVLKSIKRLFRYFKWTVENNVEALLYHPLKDLSVPFIGLVKPNQIYGYVDSTHISEERSISRFGLCIFMNGMLLLCISKKLLYVTLSATESEYVGLSEAIKHVLFFKEFLEELGENQGSIPIGNDNSGAIAIAENKGYNAGRVKHIRARVHWIQDIVEEQLVVLKKVPTKHMPADLLTKALGYEAHARHSSQCKGLVFPVVG